LRRGACARQQLGTHRLASSQTGAANARFSGSDLRRVSPTLPTPIAPDLIGKSHLALFALDQVHDRREGQQHADRQQYERSQVHFGHGHGLPAPAAREDVPGGDIRGAPQERRRHQFAFAGKPWSKQKRAAIGGPLPLLSTCGIYAAFSSFLTAPPARTGIFLKAFFASAVFGRSMVNTPLSKVASILSVTTSTPSGMLRRNEP
jgi:hypothetical protein